MPTIPPASASGSPARPSCPACGITVTAGYQRCPKCHRPLPTSVRFTRPTDGGGATTIAPPDEVVTRWPWYLAGVAVLAGAVAVIVIGSRDGGAAAPLPDDPITEEDSVETPGSSADDVDTAPAPPRPDPALAADRLARLMAAVRLYATVEPVGDTVEIRSTFCAEPRVPGLIGEVAADLREAGIVSVRCRALHGAEAWTRPLP